jgi:hypothetical protein
MGSGCIDPHFLDLGTSWRWVVSSTPLPLYPRERVPGTHFVGGWVDPRAGLDHMEKWKFLPHRDSYSRPPIVQPVASRYTDWAIPAHQVLQQTSAMRCCRSTVATPSLLLAWNNWALKNHRWPINETLVTLVLSLPLFINMRTVH